MRKSLDNSKKVVKKIEPKKVELKKEVIEEKPINEKRYVVKALKGFNDYEGKECISTNPCVRRNVGDIFKCTKERCDYLRHKEAVVLLEIEKA
jgi:hypothetical protein